MSFHVLFVYSLFKKHLTFQLYWFLNHLKDVYFFCGLMENIYTYLMYFFHLNTFPEKDNMTKQVIYKINNIRL